MPPFHDRPDDKAFNKQMISVLGGAALMPHGSVDTGGILWYKVCKL